MTTRLIVLVALAAWGVSFAQSAPAKDDLGNQLAALRRQMNHGFDNDWDGRAFESRAFESLVKRVAELPAGDDRRIEAIDIAVQHAKAAELASKAKGTADYHRDHQRLYVAWRILRSLNVIRVGMSGEELAAILGKPSKRYQTGPGKETWRWYYESPMHINPALDVDLKENVVIGSKVNTA